MKPKLQKGQLTTWKDDRGVGFIKPENGETYVFLHISALKGPLVPQNFRSYIEDMLSFVVKPYIRLAQPLEIWEDEDIFDGCLSILKTR